MTPLTHFKHLSCVCVRSRVLDVLDLAIFLSVIFAITVLTWGCSLFDCFLALTSRTQAISRCGLPTRCPSTARACLAFPSSQCRSTNQWSVDVGYVYRASALPHDRITSSPTCVRRTLATVPTNVHWKTATWNTRPTSSGKSRYDDVEYHSLQPL